MGDVANIYRQLGAGFCANEEREEVDFYATPKQAVTCLMNFLHDIDFDLRGLHVIDTSIGAGHLVQPFIDKGLTVTGYDVKNWGYKGAIIQDFLTVKELPRTSENDRLIIVQNPPYKQEVEFIEHSLSLLMPGEVLCSFNKIQLLEGQKRRERIYNKIPPKYVCVFSKRVRCAKCGNFDEYISSAVCYAWYIWKKHGDIDSAKNEITELKWIN